MLLSHRYSCWLLLLLLFWMHAFCTRDQVPGIIAHEMWWHYKRPTIDEEAEMIKRTNPKNSQLDFRCIFVYILVKAMDYPDRPSWSKMGILHVCYSIARFSHPHMLKRILNCTRHTTSFFHLPCIDTLFPSRQPVKFSVKCDIIMLRQWSASKQDGCFKREVWSGPCILTMKDEREYLPTLDDI